MRKGLIPALMLTRSLALSADLDHSLWNQILHNYVSAESRVNYEKLRSGGKSRLDAYLAIIGRKWPADMSRDARKAASINTYNALTISWILSNYPVESIWRTPHPFREARHLADGKKVSLDQIETSLRDTGDVRVHAALVCAARSCPPLRREAYVGSRVSQQLDDNTRQWLANPRLNEFTPAHNTATVSKIFDWYEKDFTKNGGSVASFLAKYAPPGNDFLKSRPKIGYEEYHWGLNDTSDHGLQYSQNNFLWDFVRNR